MIAKLIKNFKLVLVLFLILAGVMYFDAGGGGIDASWTFIKEYWWILIVGPIVLRFYRWFTNLKQKAFNAGHNMSSKGMENLSGFIDRQSGVSAKRYAKMKLEPAMNKKQAAELRSNSSEGQVKMISELSKDDFFVPLYRYEKGLPGKNKMRSSTIDHLVCYAKVKENSFDVFQVSSKDDFNQKNSKSNIIGSIPISSIMKIEVVDLRSTRVIRRAGAKMANRLMWRAVNSVSSTPLDIVAEKADASKLIIYYIDEEGILIPASFVLPSKSTFGVEAIKSLKGLRNGLRSASMFEPAIWNVIDMDSGTSEDVAEMSEEVLEQMDLIEFDDISATIGDVAQIATYMNMLSGDDSAVLTAKLSGEMISSVVQKEGLPLVMSSDSE